MHLNYVGSFYKLLNIYSLVGRIESHDHYRADGGSDYPVLSGVELLGIPQAPSGGKSFGLLR